MRFLCSCAWVKRNCSRELLAKTRNGRNEQYAAAISLTLSKQLGVGFVNCTQESSVANLDMDEGVRDVDPAQTSSRLEFELFPDDCDGLR